MIIFFTCRSLIGNPADLALVISFEFKYSYFELLLLLEILLSQIRLQTDATLPLESRANYTGK
jgi:hypothetical protein